MYPVDFPARLEDARSRKNGFVNCIGATHFLLGLTTEEGLLEPARTIPEYMGLRFKRISSGMGMPLMLPDEAVALDLRMIVFGGYQIGKNTKSG
jgi:hypothetical protein